MLHRLESSQIFLSSGQTGWIRRFLYLVLGLFLALFLLELCLELFDSPLDKSRVPIMWSQLGQSLQLFFV